MLKWPEREEVEEAARRWAEEQAREHPDVVRIGIFGSCARGDWGVGSDLDLVVVVRESDRPWTERARDFRSEALPVPADILVYTADEWERLQGNGDRFASTLIRETVWIYP